MSVFQLLTPITYWLLIAMWAYILFFFMRRLRFRRAESSLIITLIIILAIDAFRTLFESIYFGAWYTSLSGFLPIGVHDFLVRAEMVIIPEFLNVLAAALIIGILLYRWFPAEKRDRELLEGTIKEHTIKLEKSNEQLRHEITECKQAVEETHLLLIATQAIGESQDFYDGLRFVLRNVCETTGWSFGEAWVPSSDGKILKCSPAWYGSTNSLRKFRKLSEEVTFPPNVGLPGRVWSSKQPEWIPDVSSESKAVFLRTQIMLESGLKAGYGVPIIANSQVLAVLVFFMFEPREEDNRLVELISVVATQLGSVILRKQAEEALKKQTYDIGERVKELRCLYAVSDLAKQDIPSEEIFQRIIDLVPPAWQYPEVTCARLTVNSQEFRTKNFRETAWKQTSDIVVRGNRIGNVEVCYLEEKPESDEGPFLKEERDLIIAITRHLGETIERKQAEREIKRAAEEWATTFDSITDLVSIHDKDFRLVRVNKAFADLFKMKPEELIGKYCYEVAHGANEPAPYCPHKQTLDDGKPHRLEYFETHLGIHLEMIVSPIFDEKGEVSGTVHVTEDITERKKMEEQLIVTDRLASIGELSSGIAHELNNPLTSVIGFSELLLEKDVSDDVKEDLAVINREAKRTAVVVRNLLTFARKHHTEKKPVDIHDIIQKVLELRAYEQKVSNITVNTRSTPNLPEIIADGFQLQQVFLNIIINAEHFLKETHQGGTLTITTERVGNIVRVSFADDGPGIAEENLMHLFDPFFTTKEVGKGTGLGLSICHGIITEHGGRIYAESELGKGATFIVELPIPSRGGESNEKS